MKRGNFKALIIGVLLAGAGASDFAAAAILPDTERGNIVLRKLDDYEPGPTWLSYIGHVGIFGGWEGNDATDPTDFFVYDLGTINKSTPIFSNPVTVTNVTVNKRPFKEFTEINLITGQATDSYSGGFTPNSNVGSLDPDLRQTIKDRAADLVDDPFDSILFPFTKNFADSEFRCDGYVEYSYEQAGVGGGSGLWPIYVEQFIPAPVNYIRRTVRQTGTPPSMGVRLTDGTLIPNGGATNETTIVVSATETLSGLQMIALVGPSGSTHTVTGIKTTDTHTFSSLSDGNYTASAYDLAGNQTSVAFMVGANHFLDERWA